VLAGAKVGNTHETPWRRQCNGTLRRVFLGHEFKTDVVQLRIDGHRDSTPGFWLSLLYALLEGLSAALDIERSDLDGCLYAYAGDPSCPALVLFDDVPGGAGHVRRLVRDEETLRRVLLSTLRLMKQCDCGGEEADTSCYGCLRNYRNQFCHDQLKRGLVIQFLSALL